jgi:transcription elongation factor Elf1
MTKKFICPRCKMTFNGYPAISRKDNKTEICSDCGTAEALEDFANFTQKKLGKKGVATQ